MDISAENLQTIMGLIVNGGDAKSNLMESIYAAKAEDFKLAEEKMRMADDSLNKAHNSQTTLLTKEAAGESAEISLLMVHAQDHLMNAITFRDLTQEIIDIHKEISILKQA